MKGATSPNATTCLIDVVFPGDTNHHGTLFGGVGLAYMDKVAFIAASRHAQVDFVTASCERIDFKAPANLGDIVELNGRVIRVGRRSLSVEVDMVAEAPLSAERRLCARGIFNMVALGPAGQTYAGRLPPLPSASASAADPALRMVEAVFPDKTSHYGSLYGGNALAAMAKSAFVVATRHCRKAVVLASSQRVDLVSQVQKGEVVELTPRLVHTGVRSMAIEVGLWAENLQSGMRRACGCGTFIMVATAGHSGRAEGSDILAL
jgi:acyl-CoA hydrolase